MGGREVVAGHNWRGGGSAATFMHGRRLVVCPWGRAWFVVSLVVVLVLPAVQAVLLLLMMLELLELLARLGRLELLDLLELLDNV